MVFSEPQTQKSRRDLTHAAFASLAALLGGDDSGDARGYGGRLVFAIHLLPVGFVLLPRQSIVSFRHYCSHSGQAAVHLLSRACFRFKSLFIYLFIYFLCSKFRSGRYFAREERNPTKGFRLVLRVWYLRVSLEFGYFGLAEIFEVNRKKIRFDSIRFLISSVSKKFTKIFGFIVNLVKFSV